MRKTEKINIRSAVETALMSALICVSSFLTVPFAAVPITLQTFGIYFALFTLGGKRGTFAVSLYILIGSAGLPVFSGFSGGIARLFDATGGYIFGFFFAALLFWLMTSFLPNTPSYLILSASVSLLLVYAVGSVWYALVYLGGAQNAISVLSLSVLPFIIPDALKIALAYLLSARIKRIIRT